MGSNPGTVYWMDIFSHIFVVKICNVCLKRPKINKKEAGVGPFFFKKNCRFQRIPSIKYEKSTDQQFSSNQASKESLKHLPSFSQSVGLASWLVKLVSKM